MKKQAIIIADESYSEPIVVDESRLLEPRKDWEGLGWIRETGKLKGRAIGLDDRYDWVFGYDYDPETDIPYFVAVPLKKQT